MRFLFGSFLIVALLCGCSTVNTSQQIEFVSGSYLWGIAPFTNNTEIPQAGNRAMAITSGILRSKGVLNLFAYHPATNCNQLIVCPNSGTPIEELLNWSRTNNLNYLMIGSVNEWEYKVGIDGEPVAAVTLQLYDVPTGIIIWSSVGSKIGTSRSGLGNTAQSLISGMLGVLKILP